MTTHVPQTCTAFYQPCPFCGARKIAHHYRNDDKEVRLSCANPDCSMRVYTPWLASLKAAISAWNTRRRPPEIPSPSLGEGQGKG